MDTEVGVTELVELDASRLDGVAAPANGTPWLIMKAKAPEADDDAPDSAADGPHAAPETPFGENAGERLTDEQQDAFAANTERVKNGKKPAKKEEETGGEPHDTDTDSTEADQIEQEVTGEAAKAHAENAYCGEQTCEKCTITDGTSVRLRPGIQPLTKAAAQARAYYDLVKRDIDPAVGGGVDRDKIPAEDFAGKDRSFPIVTPKDAGDAAQSIGRAGEDNYPADKLKANIIAIAERKGAKFTAELPKKWRDAMKKGAVQESLQGTKAPQAAGLISDGARSGIARPATAGPLDRGSTVPEGRQPTSQSGMTTPLAGGESAYVVIAEADAFTVANDIPAAPGVVKAMALATLASTIDELAERREAQKDAGWLSMPGPTVEQSAQPGSMPWESYDSATLDQVASVLAQCCNAVEQIATREQIEAITGDAGDVQDAWDLDCAADCLDQAMGIVARLAYHEGAQAQKSTGDESPSGAIEKAYRRLRVGDEKALRDAHAALSSVLARHDRKVVDAGQEEPSEGDKIQMELTKEELAGLVASTVTQQFDARDAQAQKVAKKQAKKAAKLAKNANNGGDISAAQMRDEVGAAHDADDIEAAALPVEPRYVNVNKGEKKAAKAMKAMADQLEAANAQIASLGEQVQKFAARPRSGGPILTGIAPGGVFPAGEQRHVDGAQVGSIEQLVKSAREQIEQTDDPLRKQEIGLRATQEALRQQAQRQFGDGMGPLRTVG